MKLILFGATGRIGRQALVQGLERGHTVTAFVRDAAKLDVTHLHLTVVVGDVRDALAVAAAIPRHDAVISAMGPGGSDVSDKHLDVLTDGIRHLLQGMHEAGLRRIVVLGSVATLNAAPDKLLRDLPDFPDFARNISGAHLEAWKTLEASGLDWTVICPAPMAEPGERTGHYRTRADFLLDGGPQLRITTGDVADLMLDEVERGKYTGHRVSIAY